MWRKYGSGVPTFQARQAQKDRDFREQQYQDEMRRQQELQRLSTGMEKERHQQDMAMQQFQLEQAKQAAPYEEQLRNLQLQQERAAQFQAMSQPRAVEQEAMEQEPFTSQAPAVYHNLPEIVDEVKQMEHRGEIPEGEGLNYLFDFVARQARVQSPEEMQEIWQYIQMLYHGREQMQTGTEGW